MSETLTNTQIIIKDDNGQIHTSKSLGQQDETRLNNMVKLMNLILNTPNSTDFINTLASKDFTNINNTAKIAIAHNAMPSNVYDALTVGVSGATYTAPADGYFVIHADLNPNGNIHFVTVSNSNGILYQLIKNAYSYTTNHGTYIPVQKGDALQFTYSNLSQVYSFTFVYAVGSESEQV